jgi:drug/metabolite transporter (DMT)-like permease
MRMPHFLNYKQPFGNFIVIDREKNGRNILPLQVAKSSKSLCGSFGLLNIVAIIWGTQHAVIKMIINDTHPSHYSLLRFAMAAFISSPYIPGIQTWTNKTSIITPNDNIENRKVWRWGVELGILMFLGFAFQAIGMENTTASRSGFLLYLNVKFVPLFALLLLGRGISLATWISAFVTFFGTALLATGDRSIGFNIGDVWSIAAAISSAMFILRIEKASVEVKRTSQLSATCLWVVTGLSSIWAFFKGDVSIVVLKDIIFSHPIELVYLGCVATALTNYIQTLVQKGKARY